MTREQINATATALATVRFERGGRVTADEEQALAHWSMFGSTGYPVRKVGRKWTIDARIMAGAPLYATKRDAEAAWETRIMTIVRLKGLQQHAEATN